MSSSFLSVSRHQLPSEARNISLIGMRYAALSGQLVTLPQANILDAEGSGSIATVPEDTVLAFICQRNISRCDVAGRVAAPTRQCIQGGRGN